MADIQKLNVNGNAYDISTAWDKVTGKPSTFPPESHTHSYLPLTGGSISGSNVIGMSSAGLPTIGGSNIATKSMAIGVNGIGISGTDTRNDGAAIFLENNGTEANRLIIALGDDSTQNGSQDYTAFRYYDTAGAVTYESKIPFKNGTLAIHGDPQPASDVYAWAKAASKPTYTYSEVGAAPASHSHDYLPFTQKTVTSITTSLNDCFSYGGFHVTNWAYAGSSYVNNQPWGNGASSAATVVAFPGSYPFQFCRFYSTNDIYIRGYYSGTGWTSWNKIALSGESQPASDVYTWAKAASKPSYTYSEVGAAPASHSHDYLPFYRPTSADCNTMSQGLTILTAAASNQNASNHSAFLTITDIGTPFQLQIPDAGEAYIYKRYKSGGSWSSWFKIYAGYADSAGSASSVPWSGITGKPSTFPAESHTHSYLPLAGGTLTGVLKCAANGLVVNSDGGDTAIRVLKAYGSGASNSGAYYINFGNNPATSNCCELTFNYVGSGSSSNYSGIGFYGGVYFKIYANGNSVNPGTMTASGFYQSSDERLKTFYDPIKVDLEKLKKLRKNYFKFNDKDELEIGVSAQEIQSLYPEIVSTNDEGYLSVAYDKLSVIALSAIDKLDDDIKELKQENNDLKDQLKSIKDQLKAIKNILKEEGIL